MKIKLLMLLGALLLSNTFYAKVISFNAKKSSIQWKAKKLGGAHDGHIMIKSASAKEEDGKLIAGEFEVDMTSITCDDLKDASYNAKLVGHLKSDDFFGSSTYPTSKLSIIRSSKIGDKKLKIKAKLTIKKTTKEITFEAMKTNMGYEATIVIDRSDYDVRYGSRSFFDNLGDKFIYDDFTLMVKLVK